MLIEHDYPARTGDEAHRGLRMDQLVPYARNGKPEQHEGWVAREGGSENRLRHMGKLDSHLAS